MNPGDRVIVRGNPGTVKHTYPDGDPYVRLDSGGACTFPAADVHPAGAAKFAATQKHCP